MTRVDKLRLYNQSRIEPNVLDVLNSLSPPPRGVLRIVEIDDIIGEDANLMTDGCGYISADLADAVPMTAHGRRVSGPRGPSMRNDDDDDGGGGCGGGGGGGDGGGGGGGGGGALVMQVRLWYGGSVCKGTLMRSSLLPERTLIARTSMRKVDDNNYNYYDNDNDTNRKGRCL